jgi:hypothetical protein
MNGVYRWFKERERATLCGSFSLGWRKVIGRRARASKQSKVTWGVQCGTRPKTPLLSLMLSEEYQIQNQRASARPRANEQAPGRRSNCERGG